MDNDGMNGDLLVAGAPNDIGISNETWLSMTPISQGAAFIFDMQGNEVGDDGAIALAEALQQMPRFRRLYIGDRIGERGREALGRAQSI